MHPFRLLTAFAGVALVAVPAAAQTFEGVIGLRTPQGPVEAMVKSGRARLNTQSPMGAASIIVNPEAKELYIVVDAQKMVMVMKPPAATQRADSTSPADTTSVTPLGVKATVAGHECEVFRFRSGKAAQDVCISSGLGELGVGQIFGGMGSGMGMMMGRGGAGASTAWTGALARKGGFPLRVADTTGTVQYEVTRIEPRKLDEALFTPPADYQRMEMPSFGRPPGSR